MNIKSPMTPVIKYMSFVLFPLAAVAVVALAVAGGAVIVASFSGQGLGVAALSGGVSILAFVTMLLAARFGFPRSRRQGVTAGRVTPIRFF